MIEFLFKRMETKRGCHCVTIVLLKDARKDGLKDALTEVTTTGTTYTLSLGSCVT